jgi:hypothetical protein
MRATITLAEALTLRAQKRRMKAFPRAATLELFRASTLELSHASTLELSRASTLELSRASTLELPNATTLELSHATTLELPRASTLELPRATTLELSRATTLELFRASTLILASARAENCHFPTERTARNAPLATSILAPVGFSATARSSSACVLTNILFMSRFSLSPWNERDGAIPLCPRSSPAPPVQPSCKRHSGLS